MTPNYIRLSDSAIKDFDRCPKRFKFAQMERLRSQERVKVFDVGSLGHTGCMTYLHPKNMQFDKTERYKLARAAIMAHYERMKADNRGEVDKDVLTEVLHTFPVIMRRNRSGVVLSVEQWWETKIKVPIVSHDGDFDTFTIELVGKGDVVTFDEGVYFIEEHKFIDARGFGGNKKDSYARSRQTKIYVFLAQRALKEGKVIRGVRHNYFLKKQNPELIEETTYVGPKDLLRVEHSIIDTARDIRRCMLKNYWRENLDACYGDWKPCPYARLCEFGDTKEIRQQNFVVYQKSEKFAAHDASAEASKQSSSAADVPPTTGELGPGVDEGLVRE